MAFTATNIIPLQRTVQTTAVAVLRGTRLTMNTSGLCAASAIGVRGDYIAVQDIAASSYGLAAPTAAGGSIAVIASENTTLGAAAYSAASGLTSVTATNAVLMGKWKTATAANTLGIIELESVA